MTPVRIYVRGTGVITPLGVDGDEILDALAEGVSGLRPLTRFDSPHQPPLPVGQVKEEAGCLEKPLTHRLAWFAAEKAMAGTDYPPDAIVLGVTTGGMDRTEERLKAGCRQPEEYHDHALHTVTQDLARRLACKGPLITVSTACSSGGAAIAVALAMLKSGVYHSILAGGADALCRLTYHGFKSLQLIDPDGARPLDQMRRGMSLAEGAGMLLLEAADFHENGIELLGAGLSCDAHHPAQPHPDGCGAQAAMQEAIASAGLEYSDIDYINLHGTGTIDNDRSESRAINALFNNAPPQLSSIKGATGHTLGAAGAIEAVVATQVIANGRLPINVGCRRIDPDLNLEAVDRQLHSPVDNVLSNSFGFGGNNAVLIIGRSQAAVSDKAGAETADLRIVASSLITGSGPAEQTIERLSRGLSCQGRLEASVLCRHLPPRTIRRVKRLSQIVLALLQETHVIGTCHNPKAVFFGSGWGCLTETHDFLQALFESEEKFSSPTDFIGSVHNAPAGQIALMAKARDTNLTLSGGDHSFEQALFCAQLMAKDGVPVFVAAADEAHDELSPLFDRSMAGRANLSDGGGALILKRSQQPIGSAIKLLHLSTNEAGSTDLRFLIERLGGSKHINAKYGLLLAGIPAAERTTGQAQLERFTGLTGFAGQVMDYRRLTGEFASASAVATVFAAQQVQSGAIRVAGGSGQTSDPGPDAALILGFGDTLSAVEVVPA